jgi:hypothetical protein
MSTPTLIPHTDSFSLVTTPMDATLFYSAEPGCEHPLHFAANGHTSPRHAAGGETYVRFVADCGHINPGIKVVCGKWIEYVTAHQATIPCIVCNRTYPTKDAVKIVGLVTDYHH